MMGRDELLIRFNELCSPCSPWEIVSTDVRDHLLEKYRPSIDRVHKIGD